MTEAAFLKRGVQIERLPRLVYRYVVLRCLSVLGDAAWMLSATWVLIENGGPARVGLFLAIVTTVNVSLMVPGSFVARRIGLRRVMILSDTASCVVALASSISWVVVGPQLWLVFATGIALAVCEALYGPAAGAFVRSVATDDFLTRAIGLRQSAVSVAGIVGTVAGGTLVALAGFGWVLAADAATFALIAVGLTVGFRGTEDPVPRSERSHGTRRVLRATMSRLWRDTVVRLSLVRNAAVNLLGMGLLNVGLIAFVQSNGWNAIQLAVVEGAISVGVIVGGATLSRTREPRRPFQVAALGILTFAVAASCMVTIPSYGVCLLAAAVTGTSVVLGSACGDSALFKALPADDMVVTNAVVTGIAMAGVPLGQVLTGALIARTSVTTANLILSGTLCATALILWAASLRISPSAEATPSAPPSQGR